MLNYAKLRSPPGDGDTLIEPPAWNWERFIDQNVRRQKSECSHLAGRPIDEVRQATRAALAGRPSCDRIIAAGHQPVFVHPGVWAKHVVLRRIADRLGVGGLDLVVDNDAPGPTGLLVPVAAPDGLLGTEEIALAGGPAGSAHEGRPPLDRPAVEAIRNRLTAALAGRFAESAMPAYLDGLAAGTSPRDAVDQHLAGRAKIDGPLAADLPERRVSDVFGGPFVADLLLDAGRFAACYNESLADYRRRQRVRGASRPLPDLGGNGDRIETAFWIYKPLQRRRRLWMRAWGDRISIYGDQEHVADLAASDLLRDPDAAVAALGPWVVRPRALTLTLWARLLACDLFVHGIGGAKYDRITDGVFRRYYQCEPPAYACVSATLRLPLPRRPATPADLADARLRVRDWPYNPDRYLLDAPGTRIGLPAELAELLAERAALIAESDRLRETRGPSPDREAVFRKIRRVNARLVELHPEVGRALAERLASLGREVASNRIADSREYFYALQPRDRLADLASRLAQACRLPD